MCSRIPVDQRQWREAQFVHLGTADASAMVPALVVLALLLGIQLITTDLCLPALSGGLARRWRRPSTRSARC